MNKNLSDNNNINNIFWTGDERGMNRGDSFVADFFDLYASHDIDSWFSRKTRNSWFYAYNFALPQPTGRRQQSPTFQFHLTQLGSPMNHDWQVQEHFFVALTKVIIILMIMYVEKHAGNQENRLKYRLMKFGNTIYHFLYSLNKTPDPHVTHGMWSATADSGRWDLASLDYRKTM